MWKKKKKRNRQRTKKPTNNAGNLYHFIVLQFFCFLKNPNDNFYVINYCKHSKAILPQWPF